MKPMPIVFMAGVALSLISCGAAPTSTQSSTTISNLSDGIEIDRAQPTSQIFEFKRTKPEAYYYSINPFPVREFSRTGHSFEVFLRKPVGQAAAACRPLELVSCFENHSAAVFLRHGTCFGDSEFKERLGYICERPTHLTPARNRFDVYTRKENYNASGWWRNVYRVSEGNLGHPWQHKYLLGYFPN